MPEDEFIRHLSEKKPLDKILDSTANIVESIGRNSGKEYDNLTAAILEMNSNSILKEKMNRKAKILIAILAIFLIISVTLNTLLFMGVNIKDNVIEKQNVEVSGEDLETPTDSVQNKP